MKKTLVLLTIVVIIASVLVGCGKKDTTPPGISAVSSSGVTNSTATITWTTNESATSQVEYGTTTSYGSSTTLNTTLTTSHSVGLSGLTPGTTYHYKVKSKDKEGNEVVSDDKTFTTLAPSNQSPAQPNNVSPANGASNISVTPTLSSSSFSDPDAGDTHAASQWQITTTSGNYTSPVFNSTSTTNLISIAIPSGILGYSTTYYWHVRYQDNHGAWSSWSSETSFTTVAPQPPNQPSNVWPSDGASDISVTPTISSSSFSDPDAGDTHAASQWQIATTSGNYTSPVFDSGLSTTNLTGILIPSGVLSYSTTYYWHVKYQDNHGVWSSWSNETSFTTSAVPNQPPNQPSNVLPSDGATGISVTPTVSSSSFSDPDAGDTHAASQWQIRRSSGSYSSPAFDSGISTTDLTSILIPSGILGYSTTYYWHVRHQDNHGDWSSWSNETSFTTVAIQPGSSWQYNVTFFNTNTLALTDWSEWNLTLVATNVMPVDLSNCAPVPPSILSNQYTINHTVDGASLLSGVMESDGSTPYPGVWPARWPKNSPGFIQYSNTTAYGEIVPPAIAQYAYRCLTGTLWYGGTSPTSLLQEWAYWNYTLVSGTNIGVPYAVGNSWNLTIVSCARPATGCLSTYYWNYFYNVTAMELVTVPAGTFMCYKVQVYCDWDQWPQPPKNAGNGFQADELTNIEWYAPSLNFALVKRFDYLTFDGPTIDPATGQIGGNYGIDEPPVNDMTEKMELISYNLVLG